MTKPTIHLNGTGRSDLYEQYADAGAAIGKAVDKLYACQPNARDYYPQGDGAAKCARLEHDTRIKRLQDVGREIQELLEHVCDAPGPGGI